MTKREAVASVAGPAKTTVRSDGGEQSVYNELRRLILMGDLEPGAEISQLELADRLKVSRTPLREALRQLVSEGLVVSGGPHRSVRISTLSMSDLDDLYSMRVLGEGLAIWLTVPILRGEDFERLERDLELTTSRADADAHGRFHAGLRIGAGARLNDELSRQFDHAERYQRAFLRLLDPEVFAVKVAEHRAILDACAARDAERARDLMVDHLAGTAMHLMTSQRHAPFALPAAVVMAKAGRSAGRG
ncbi:GntR family transcriptional regulator [Actinacidiphila paucisporea]|uniref:DNA-binding transcriptional regulator, GntR family n=1 Tax=Actinacidiphila paucisporea TaxID=310782 RepID=A0A1M7G544_9ACTN|nr:GntR family transcriptional regulator [Actinacidiphila paucisporea]SHM11275.1 DNA-binding transcriptional regulator, GntR family [Actinacidiphila paucisporea]